LEEGLRLLRALSGDRSVKRTMNRRRRDTERDGRRNGVGGDYGNCQPFSVSRSASAAISLKSALPYSLLSSVSLRLLFRPFLAA